VTSLNSPAIPHAMSPSVRNLVLVLGDQLSPRLSSLAACDPARDAVLMCEVAEETSYVKHHKKKIVLLFSAMRHSADELAELGWRVFYTRLDDAGNSGNLAGEVERAIAAYRPQRIVVTVPGEWRLFSAMQS